MMPILKHASKKVSRSTPRFSLIVATIDRSEELAVLLTSLAAQQMRNFELIVVDQNPDDRLNALLSSWNIKEGIDLKHLRCGPGVSRARNLGIAHSTGEILAFPDDDCWYHPDTLKNVDAWFRQNPEYGVLSLGCRDEQGRISSNSWWQKECDIQWWNAFRTTAALCFFVQRPADLIPLQFDEQLGPGAGTTAGCGEDTDFVMTLLGYGLRGRFTSSWHIGHPCREGGFKDEARARRYGGGFGHVLAKHSRSFLFAGFVAFDFSRAIVHRLFDHQARAAQLWSHGQGIVEAYFQSNCAVKVRVKDANDRDRTV